MSEELCPTCDREENVYCSDAWHFGAGERPDAIPEAAVEAYLRGASGRTHRSVHERVRDGLTAAAPFIRAAHPEADRAPEKRVLDPEITANERRARESKMLPDRAPETWAGQERQWEQGSSGVGEADRAPEEVERSVDLIQGALHGDSIGRDPGVPHRGGAPSPDTGRTGSPQSRHPSG